MKFFHFMIKRLFDFVISLVLIILLFPLMLIVAISIRIDSKGPAIYKQERLGKDGKIFMTYKFRTMYDNSSINNLEAPRKGDPRVTRIGKYLRKVSLDELPQLFNVLNNTMSIIGPRAVPEKEITLRLNKLIKENPEEKNTYIDYMNKRKTIKPGITGMAQAYGRSSLSTLEATKLDVYYVDNYSLLLDIRIFFKSIHTVLLQKGVN